MKKDKKIFGIFNVLDLVIIAVVIIAGVFATIKITANKEVEKLDANKETMIEFYVEEVPDFIVGHIKEGDIVKDALQSNDLGRVISVEYGAPIFWNPNSQGEILPAAKEGYVSVRVLLKTTGAVTNSGINVNAYNYYINKSMEIRVGSVALYGKLSDISERDVKQTAEENNTLQTNNSEETVVE